jgi:hypothetical protein
MRTNKNNKRISTKLFTIFASLILFSANLKAQFDDPIEGVYVDGVKISELNCYSFGDMDVVFSLEKLRNFEAVSIFLKVVYEGDQTHYAQSWEVQPLNNLKMNSFESGGKEYIKFKTIKKGVQESVFFIPKSLQYQEIAFQIKRGQLMYDYVKGTKKTFKVSLSGATQTGWKEDYNANCNCVQKIPTYNTTLYKEFIIDLKNTSPPKGFLKTPGNTPVDLNTPCEVSGTKLQDLVKSGSSDNNSNKPNTSSGNQSNTETKSNSTKTSETTNNTTATASSSPLNSNSLKPLDKNKAGYYVQKEGDIVLAEGYKKDNRNIGERREYDEQGKLNHISTFDENGKKSGLGVEYDPATGNILSTGNYKNFLKDGEWKRYKNGKLVGTDTYEKGVKQ